MKNVVLIMLMFAMTVLTSEVLAQNSNKTELKAGEILNPGVPLFSKNGNYVLIMENSTSSGRYGIFSTFACKNFSTNRAKNEMSSQPKTTLGKATQKEQKLKMQADGNMATYDFKNDTFIWNSGTSGSKAVKMIVENDGSVSLYDANNNKVWIITDKGVQTVAPPALAANNTLLPGKTLGVGGKITSQNGKYIAKVGDDGNICIYQIVNGKEHFLDENNNRLWCSMTNGTTLKPSLQLSGEGNLTLTDNQTKKELFNSNTKASKATKLVIENNGKLNLYNAAGKVVWTAASSWKM